MATWKTMHKRRNRPATRLVRQLQIRMFHRTMGFDLKTARKLARWKPRKVRLQQAQKLTRLLRLGQSEVSEQFCVVDRTAEPV